MILYHIILAINYIDLGFSKSKKHSSFTDIVLYNATFKKIIVYLQVCNPVRILKIGFIRNQEAKSALKIFKYCPHIK